MKKYMAAGLLIVGLSTIGCGDSPTQPNVVDTGIKINRVTVPVYFYISDVDHKPIEHVTVYNVTNNEVAYTDSEGRALVICESEKDNTFSISREGYATLTLPAYVDRFGSPKLITLER